MTSKKIEPTDRMIRDVETWGEIMGIDDVDLLRYILNHPDAPGLLAAEWKANAEAAAERAERAEDRLSDSVHVDEAATRVEAAREQGWDDAAQHIYNKGWEGVTALRKANPYRPAQELPTKAGTLIIPADGREYIEAEVWGETYHASEAILLGGRAWLGAWRSPHGIQTDVTPDQITTGTWKVDGEDSA